MRFTLEQLTSSITFKMSKPASFMEQEKLPDLAANFKHKNPLV